MNVTLTRGMFFLMACSLGCKHNRMFFGPPKPAPTQISQDSMAPLPPMGVPYPVIDDAMKVWGHTVVANPPLESSPKFPRYYFLRLPGTQLIGSGAFYFYLGKDTTFHWFHGVPADGTLKNLPQRPKKRRIYWQL